jgi:hypothetical protein
MRTSFHHQPEAQHPKSSVIHKNAGRLLHLSDQQRTNCAVGLDRLRSVWPLADVPIVLANVRFRGKAEAPSAWGN